MGARFEALYMGVFTAASNSGCIFFPILTKGLEQCVKSGHTGVICHQKGPKNFGPGLFGPKPVDRPANEVLGSFFTFLDVNER